MWCAVVLGVGGSIWSQRSAALPPNEREGEHLCPSFKSKGLWGWKLDACLMGRGMPSHAAIAIRNYSTLSDRMDWAWTTTIIN